MKTYDLVTIGVISKDLNIIMGREETMYSGGSYCAAYAAVNSGFTVAMITKIADEDRQSLPPLQAAGIDVYAIPSPQTTAITNVYRTANVDDRTHHIRGLATPFRIEDFPTDIAAKIYHISALIAGEIPLDVVKHLAQKGRIGLDVQGYMRMVAGTDLIPQDWPEKAEAFSCVDILKTDASEAAILTGKTDREEAIRVLTEMGVQEIVLTNSSEVLAYADGTMYRAPFKARNLTGRTGRGDTCFATYLTQRIRKGPEDAVKYAAALTSVKMETPGPFKQSLAEVEALLATY